MEYYFFFPYIDQLTTCNLELKCKKNKEMSLIYPLFNI